MIKFEDYIEIFKTKDIFNSLVKKASELSSKKDNLIVSDFDDTIFSQKEIMDTDARKGKRGNEGNEYIMNVIGLENFISKFYVGKKFPTNIISKLDKSKDLILTTGIYELQNSKIKTCKLDNYNYIIVPHAIDKILSLIKYIINQLKFLPKKITIYEDRPEYFIEYKDLIENLIGCKLEIFFVEMDGNEGYKKIKKIIG